MPPDNALLLCCFNLVIERLLISGLVVVVKLSAIVMFPSRYRAASHFRVGFRYPAALFCDVSISLSSGFSFQAKALTHLFML